MASAAVLLIVLSFVDDPTMSLLLHSMLPESWETCPWFLACLMEEACLMTVLTAIAVPMWQVQVVAFDLANISLDKMVSNMQNRLT